MRRTTLYRPGKLFCFLAMLVLAGTAAFALVPSAPRYLYGYLDENPDGSKYVQLQCGRFDSTGGAADGFYIYQAIEDNGQYTFSKVATIPDPAQYFIQHRIAVDVAGNYRYYATAYNSDGESEASNLADVRVYLESIRFTSPTTRVDSTVEGMQYTCDFDAVSNTNETLRYRLAGSPAGMTIDPVTGVVTWTAPTPTQSNYPYTVVAYLERDSSIMASKQMILLVAPDPAFLCAVLLGSATDSSGAPIRTGTVVAYGLGADSNAVRATISNGSYVMHLRAGDYHLKFEANGYVDQWYENAGTRREASAVSVTCQDTTVVSFVANSYYPPNNRNDSIMGRVVRASDNSPLASTIQIYATRNGFDSLLSVTSTNAYGYYTALLPTGLQIVVKSVPADSTIEPQYFNRSSSRANAQVVSVPNHSINFFHGEEPPRYDNEISGVLLSPDSIPVIGIVRLYQVVEEQGQTILTEKGFMYTRMGIFYFTGQTPGNYILFGMSLDTLNSSEYMPGYYKAHSLAVLTWAEATTITIDGDDHIADLRFYLQEQQQDNGRNLLRGTITAATGGTGKISRNNLLGSNPIAGAVVYAINAQNQVNGWAITDAQGQFTINGLGVGTFTVLVDKIGYAASRQMVTFIDEESEQSVDPILQPSNSTSSAPEAPAARIAASAFPNPTSAQFTVRFNATSGTAQVSLANATGSQVLVRTVETAAGENTVIIETANLASGVYIMTLQQGTSVTSMPINIVR